MNDYYNDIAKQALAQYPNLDGASIEFFVEESNMNYMIEHDNKKYFMKIFVDHSSTIDDNLAEAVLLEHLSQTTTIHVPRVLKNQDDEYVTIVTSSIDQKQKHILVATFLTGEPLDGNETKERMTSLGRAMAQLHDSAKSLVIPDGVSFKRWDRVLYWRGEVPLYNDPKYHRFTTERDRKLLDQVFPYLDHQLQQLYQDPPILVHGDINPWNVLLEDETIKLIDFEDAIVATAIQDIAITLFYYRHDPNFIYEEIRAWLVEGYQQVDPNFIPDWDKVEMLIVARMVNFINYVLLLEDNPTSYIQERMRRLRDYLKRYKITL